MDENEVKLETELLSELISAKHRVLEQLRELSKRQPELIGDGDLSRLLSVLSAKERLLAELQKVERRLDPFRDQDPDGRHWRSPEARNRCRQVAESCEAMLREIMVIEKRSESDLVRRRDETASRLDIAHTAANARNAYLSAPPAQAGRLDLTSES